MLVVNVHYDSDKALGLIPTIATTVKPFYNGRHGTSILYRQVVALSRSFCTSLELGQGVSGHTKEVAAFDHCGHVSTVFHIPHTNYPEDV